MHSNIKQGIEERIPLGPKGFFLTANLQIPEDAKGLVIFAHGSGSSRLSPRNKYVAERLNEAGMATLLTDLLMASEDTIYDNRFNIALLSSRLVIVTDWAMLWEGLQDLPIGYFGASTGAASAIQAAVLMTDTIKAIVSRGGRPDLATYSLPFVNAPTILIVGSLDTHVIELNKLAFDSLKCEKKMEIIEGASHLFEEPGKLGEIATIAANWFEQHLFFSGFLPGKPA